MWNGIDPTTEGGRNSLPSFIGRITAAGRACALLVPAVLLCFCGGTLASARHAGARQRVDKQRPVFPKRVPNGQRPAGKNNARVVPTPLLNTDPEARRLLVQMLHPKTGFVGEETTQIAQGGRTSQQTIKGDTNGQIIRFYTSPDFLKGDIMLTGPNLYAYYYSKGKRLERIEGGRQEDKREQKVLEGLDDGRFSAQITGRESIYGRNTAIVTVFQGRQPAPAKVRAKFWIDLETGIKIQMELMDGHGIQTSHSTIQITAIGPDAVGPKDFAPPEFTSAEVNVLQRENFRTLAEAGGKLPFQPVLPPSLPAGFHLGEVTIVTSTNGKRPGPGNIVLRFTNGTAFFTLHERIILYPNRPNAKGQFNPTPNFQRWRTSSNTPAIEIIYRGRLVEEQVSALKAALNAYSY